MVEKGVVSGEHKDRESSSSEDNLALGIAIIGIGISLLIGRKFNLNGILMTGIMFISICIGLLVSYFWKKIKTNKENTNE